MTIPSMNVLGWVKTAVSYCIDCNSYLIFISELRCFLHGAGLIT